VEHSRDAIDDGFARLDLVGIDVADATILANIAVLPDADRVIELAVKNRRNGLFGEGSFRAGLRILRQSRRVWMCEPLEAA